MIKLYTDDAAHMITFKTNNAEWLYFKLVRYADIYDLLNSLSTNRH